MSNGYIRIIGEEFPKIVEKPPPEIIDNLEFFQNAAHTIDKIDYKVIVACAGRKLALYSGQIYQQAEYEYKKLVSIARKNNTVVEIMFFSNDFLVEKYKRDA